MARMRLLEHVLFSLLVLVVVGCATPVKVSEAGTTGSDVSRGLTTGSGKASSPNKKAPHADELKRPGPAKKLSGETPVPKDQRKPRQAKAKKSKSTRSREAHPWSVQVGSYSVKRDAEAMAKKLKDKGYDSYVVAAEVRGKKRYRVRVGHLAGKEEAERLQKKLLGMEGFKEALVTKRK